MKLESPEMCRKFVIFTHNTWLDEPAVTPMYTHIHTEHETEIKI
jgi:hypothetical protein